MPTAKTRKLIPLDESSVAGISIPPGETLREELRARNLTQTEFARSIGRPLRVINEIVTGKKAITAETALQFEEALGVPARVWLNLEFQHRLDLARSNKLARPAAS